MHSTLSCKTYITWFNRLFKLSTFKKKIFFANLLSFEYLQVILPLLRLPVSVKADAAELFVLVSSPAHHVKVAL